MSSLKVTRFSILLILKNVGMEDILPFNFITAFILGTHRWLSTVGELDNLAKLCESKNEG